MLWLLLTIPPAFQSPVQRIEGLSPDLESLGYAVAVVRDPEQRKHIDVAISAPRESGSSTPADDYRGRVFLFDLANRALVGVVDGFDGFGVDLHWLGDVDRDGWPDFVSGSFASGLNAFSGATGRPIWTREAEGCASVVSATLDDLDGDGVRELVVRAWQSRATTRSVALEIWSGSDGRVLRTAALPLGYSYGDVVEVGDVDGDGGRDLAVLTEMECEHGRIEVHVVWIAVADLCEVRRASFGSTGLESGPRPWFAHMTTLGSLGDVDRDGSFEVTLGFVDLENVPPNERPKSDLGYRVFGDDMRARGRVLAYDARAGRELWTRECDLADRTLRVTGDGGADVDGDSHFDTLVSEAYVAPTIEKKSGQLTVVSSRDGTAIRHHSGPCWPTASFPHRAVFIGDIDGDRVEDYMATETCGAYDVAGPTEEVRVFSGRTGGEILRFP